MSMFSFIARWAPHETYFNMFVMMPKYKRVKLFCENALLLVFRFGYLALVTLV